MKIKGDELITFMAEAWPQPVDDWYWDHECFDGDPEPDAVYETDEIGPIQHQGRGDDPTNGDGHNLATLIKRWRKARDFDVFTVDAPKVHVAAIRAAIIGAGGKLR